MDKFHKHEFLDRTSVISDQFDNNILEHSEFENLPKDLQKQADDAHTSLISLYQNLAAYCLYEDV